MSTFAASQILRLPEDAIEDAFRLAGFEAHHDRPPGGISPLSSEVRVFLESDEERHRFLEFVRDANNR